MKSDFLPIYSHGTIIVQILNNTLIVSDTIYFYYSHDFFHIRLHVLSTHKPFSFQLPLSLSFFSRCPSTLLSICLFPTLSIKVKTFSFLLTTERILIYLVNILFITYFIFTTPSILLLNSR